VTQHLTLTFRRGDPHRPLRSRVRRQAGQPLALRAADVAGDPPGHRYPVRADRGAVRAEPRRGDRRRAARRVRDRLPRRNGGRRAPGGVPHPVLPPLHGYGRGGLRARRGDQERHRPGGRTRGRSGHGRQLPRPPRRPGPRGDRAARPGDGRRPADLLRSRRGRRPHRHLLLAAVAKPDLRRAPRGGHVRGRGDPGDGADRGGREGLQSDPGPVTGPRGRARITSVRCLSA
jgi:hypothetical protein